MTSTSTEACLASATANLSSHQSTIYRHKKFQLRSTIADGVTRGDSVDELKLSSPPRAQVTLLSPSVPPASPVASQQPSSGELVQVVDELSVRGHHRCNYCGNYFSKPSVLDKHIRSHTNERPFSCVACRYSFKTKSNFVKHCKTRKHTVRCEGEQNQDSYDEEQTEEQQFDTESVSESDGADVIEEATVEMGDVTRLSNVTNSSFVYTSVTPSKMSKGIGGLTHSIDNIIGRKESRSHHRCNLSRVHERPQADGEHEVQSNGSTLNGVVRHIDKVIQLNEAHLSVTRRALDNFGRHTNTLVRERAAVRHSSISSTSSSATQETNEDHLKEQVSNEFFQQRPSVLMRSHSLSADVGHVLKRRLLSVADNVSHTGGVVDVSSASLTNNSSLRTYDSDDTPFKKIRRCSSDPTNSRVLKCFTGGEMLMVPEKERDQHQKLSTQLSDHSASDASLFPSLQNPLVFTIKSNLNSGGKMIEVGDAGHSNGVTYGERNDSDSAIRAAQLSPNQVGKYCMSASSSIVKYPSWFPIGLTSSHSYFSTVDTQSEAPEAGSINLSCRDGLFGFKFKPSPVSVALSNVSRSSCIAADPAVKLTGSSRRSTFTQSSSHGLVKSHDKRRKLSLRIPAPGFNVTHESEATLSRSIRALSFRTACLEKYPERAMIRRDKLHSVDALLLQKLKNKLILSNDSAISFLKPDSHPKGSDFGDIATGLGRDCTANDDTSTGADVRSSTRLPSSLSENVSPDSGISIGSISQIDCPFVSTSYCVSSHQPVSPLTVSVCSEFPPSVSQVNILCSPDTPRPLKSVRERCIDGGCYTRIRLKSSTRPYFCCMFQTQPNYVEQRTDQRQVSMYSEWRHAVSSTSAVSVERAPCLARVFSSSEKPTGGSGGYGSRGHRWDDACNQRMLYSLPAYIQSGCTHCLSTVIGQKWPPQSNENAASASLITTQDDPTSDSGSEQQPASSSCPGRPPALSSSPKHQSASFSCPGKQLLHDSKRLTDALANRFSCIPAVLRDNPRAESENMDDDQDSSDTSREEGQKCAIDLCTRRDSPLPASDSPVLPVFNCTEELSRLYANLGSIRPKLGPTFSHLTPSSTEKHNVSAAECNTAAAPRTGDVVETTSARSVPASITTTTAEVSGTIQTETKTNDSTSSSTATSSSCHSVSASSAPVSPRKRTMRAVLDDIFQQVRSERVGAGVPSIAASTVATDAVATYCTSAATPPPIPPSTTAKSTKPVKPTVTGVAGIALHPNVTAGKPGLPLTRPPPDSDSPLHNQQQQQKSSSPFYSGDRAVCGVCGKRDFVNRDQLVAHARTHQMEQRSHRCAVCEIGFRSEQQLAKHHRSAEHAHKSAMLERRGGSALDRRIHECLFCMRGFHNAGTLHKHLRCKAHITGLENAGWLPCGVYAQMESAGTGSTTHETINVESVWSNYCHLQDLALTLLSERTCEMADWRVKFAAIKSGRQLPPSYPYEIDAKLRGNTDDARTRPVFPSDFLPLPLNGVP